SRSARPSPVPAETATTCCGPASDRADSDQQSDGTITGPQQQLPKRDQTDCARFRQAGSEARLPLDNCCCRRRRHPACRAATAAAPNPQPPRPHPECCFALPEPSHPPSSSDRHSVQPWPPPPESATI